MGCTTRRAAQAAASASIDGSGAEHGAVPLKRAVLGNARGRKELVVRSKGVHLRAAEKHSRKQSHTTMLTSPIQDGGAPVGSGNTTM
jgi:hypothetical protein